MKFLLILAPLIVAALSYVMYKEDGNIKKLIITFLLLWSVITLAIVGNVMRALSVLFMLHIVAIVMAYGATIYYAVKNKFLWWAFFSPFITMIVYLIFVWIGNEHLPNVI